jgi:hypothetical protein
MKYKLLFMTGFSIGMVAGMIFMCLFATLAAFAP